MPSDPSADRAPIALIGCVDPADQAQWLAALRQALPGERVEPAGEIVRPEQVEVAIVANPDPAEVRRFSGLRWLQSLWAGVERLVAEPAFAALPIVRMVDPGLTRAMTEAVLAWTLYLHREMPAYRVQQAAAQWRQIPYRRPGQRRIGLLGAGALGADAARKLAAAGFPVTAWSRTPKTLDGIATRHGRDGLNTVLATSDILIVLLPLTGETRGLIDAAVLALLPADAGIINFARGPIVVAADLLAALDGGRLRHAVLDVFDQEPLPPTSPLWRHPAVTVLPHIAADSDPDTAAAIAAANIRQWRTTGRIPPAVDRARGY